MHESVALCLPKASHSTKCLLINILIFLVEKSFLIYFIIGITFYLDTEVEKLKKAVESLMAANEEKERRIEELRRAMKKYRKVEEMIATSQGRKGGEIAAENFSF